MAGLVGHAATPKKWLSFHPGLAVLQGVSWGLTLVSLLVWSAGSIVGTAVVAWVVGLLVVASLVRAADWVRLVIRALALAKRKVRNHLGAALALALPALWSLPSLILPVIDSDGLRYHLGLPKLFLLEGRVFLYPWDVVGAYPQGAEMFYLLGLSLGPAEAAKWLHFLVVCLGVAALVMMVGGRRSGGLLGGLAYAATPAVLAGAGAAFIDGFSMLHIAVAAVGLKRRLNTGAVGLALAGALWSKWTVGPAVAGCLVVVVLEAARGRKWRSAFAVLAPIVLVLAPVMIRNTIVTGDPFFPITTGLVRGEVPGVDPELMDTVSQRHREIPGPLGIPWGTSIGEVESDEVIGWHHLLGLGLLPLLFRDRRVRLAAALVVPYLIVGVFYHPSIRLAMPMIWGLAVVEGLVLERLKPIVGTILVLLIAVGLLPCVGSDARSVIGPFVTGRLSAEGVVEELVPGAEAAHFVNRQPEHGRVMALDFPAPFLFDRPWVAEGLVNRPPMSLWLEQTRNVDELLARLAHHEIRWIVVTPGYGGGRPQSMLPVASTPEEAGIVLGLRQYLELVFSDDNVDVWRVR
ncbi:MAG: hypothetical protein ABFS37_07770 [Acidobacteriota bacterium]